MKDYSQSGEQAAILHALREAATGILLDIGAWHATEFSNSRALVELGWRGVLIEPSPGPMLGLIAEYGIEGRIDLVQAAVTCEAMGITKLYVSDDAVSTTEAPSYEVWKQHAAFRGSILVPTINWEYIATRWGGFGFVNIDAEGKSADLFLRMLALEIFPPCVCVEHDSRTTELLTEASKHNYSCTFANQTNLVMAR